jgi:outer membrane protein OmpA-like peptidoglycan-associated protein
VLALAALLWMRGAGRAADPQLTIANRDGRVTYSGVVRDDTTRFTIVSALEKTFGKGSVTGDLQVDRRVTRAAWLPRLDELVAAVRTPGVDLSLTGNTLNVGGWVSAADHQALIGKLQGAFGSGMTVGSLADPAVAAVRAANDKALSALRAIGTSGVNPNAVVQAMNLAVINFQTGSAQIAQDSLDVVRTSAEAIKRMPDRAKVEIRGHTDNTGDPAGNLRLSEARADAVKTALVSAGVPAERLITRGYGDTQPRASNTTEYGRFQNRRIEYGVIQ